MICFFNYRRLGWLTGCEFTSQTDRINQEFDLFFKQNQTASTVLGIACHEPDPDVYQYISNCLNQYCKKYCKTLIIVTDNIYQKLVVNWPVDHVYFVNYWAEMTFRHAKHQQQQYNIDAHKALCLTGTMDRINRIGMLAAFFNKNRLDQLRYSWIMPDEVVAPGTVNNSKKICNQFGVDYNNLEFHAHDAKINELSQSVLVSDKSYGTYKFKEQKFNLALEHWHYTKFSLVNETVFERRNNFSVTEKTWMAVYNRHPFLVINHPGVNTWLNQQGIQTIDQLIDVDFDCMILNHEKINRAVDITADLLSTNRYNKKLVDMAEQNLLIMRQQHDQSQTTLADLAARLNIHVETLLDQTLEPWAQETSWYSAKNAEQLWVNFYNEIKVPDWPECSTRKDFNSLPEWIQQELLTRTPKILKGISWLVD